MHLCRRLSLVLLASAASALFAPTQSRAAIVSISHEKLDQCSSGFVFCNGKQAYSLSEIQSGALEIPIFPILPSEVVVVNDTGHTVTNLNLKLTTLDILSFDLQCQIQPSATQFLNACDVTKSSGGLSHNLFSTISAQFTFTANNDEGIPDGAYFDITTVGFLPGGYLSGTLGPSTDLSTD